MSRYKQVRRLHGLHLMHRKGTAESQTVSMPVPVSVRIPMIQHMGAPCTPLVKVGDTVKVGQKIGESENKFSVPVHSSVSGVVKSIQDYTAFVSVPAKLVEIETDGHKHPVRKLLRRKLTVKMNYFCCL